MPRRTPDQGVRPFEVRTGIGAPTLGGMFRAGDPAAIPLHKHHMLTNVRLSPEGMTNRPGLTTVFDTGSAECIEGMIGPPGGTEPEPLVGLVLYPAGTGGFDDSYFAFHPQALKAKVESSLSLIKEDADTAAGEVAYNAIDIASASTAGGVTTPTAPFIWRGKIHEFKQVTRSTPSGTDVTDWALLEYVLPRKLGDAGTVKVVMYTGTEYDGDPIDFVGGRATSDATLPAGGLYDIPDSVAGNPTGMFRRHDDSISGAVGLVETLYFMIRTTGPALFLMKFDGATMIEVADMSAHVSWGVSLMPSCRGGIWIFPNFYDFAGPVADFYHLNPDETLTTFDGPTWATAIKTRQGGMRWIVASCQSAGYDYFLSIGMDGNFDESSTEIYRVSAAGTWSLRYQSRSLVYDDLDWYMAPINPRTMCKITGGGIAVITRALNLQVSAPDWYHYLYFDNPDDAGFVVGVDDPTVEFSSGNWTQMRQILYQKSTYLEGTPYAEYRYTGIIWMTSVDENLVIGGIWAVNDPITDSGLDAAPWTGHAIYKMVPPSYNLDQVYVDAWDTTFPYEFYYPTNGDTWTLPSLGVLLTAQGDDVDEVTTAMLGGA